MFIPYDDNVPSHRTPYVNITLIAINVVVFLALNFRANAAELILPYALHPDNVTAITLVTSMFLHGGLAHIFGNMLFLSIYGDNVEDRLGHVGYLVFYLACGFMAAFFHISTSDMPCIGASGAISGVMGAYVILYPKSKIKYLLFFWLIRPIWKTFEFYSWFTIGLWFLMQFLNHSAAGDSTGVAHAAHLGGFILGAVFTGLLVLGKVLQPGKQPRPLQRQPQKEEPPNLEALWQEAKTQGLPCPACLKVMRPNPVGGFEIEACYQCGGLWLEKGETEQLLRRPDLPYSLTNPAAQAPDRVLLPHGQRRCPACEAPLEPANIEGVDAEGCRQCSGLWLEQGELGELRDRLC